jgi:hypothetical protein
MAFLRVGRGSEMIIKNNCIEKTKKKQEGEKSPNQK